MFVSYVILSPYMISNDKELKYELIDSDFKEEFIANITDGGINVISPIIFIYEKRELNVGANIAKVLQYLHKRFDLSDFKNFVSYIFELNKDIEKYKYDIKKYLLLL